MVFSEYNKLKGSNVKYEDNVISFSVYIEGETIKIKATVEKDSLKGTASYTDGTISFTAKKKG